MMKRLLTLLLVLGMSALTAFGQKTQDFGWKPDPKETEAFVATLPVVYGNQVNELIAEDDNADALLYRALIPCLEKHGETRWIKMRGNLKVVRAYNQGSVGSCVGNATAACVSVLNAVEVAIKGESQEFVAMHSADGTYGLCREAAGYLGSRGDGCTGSGAAKSIIQLGTLYQIVYSDADLRQNVPTRARQYGYSGVGTELKREASKNKCMSATRARSAKEAWALIGNGYPINVCSGQGFAKQRDKEGICRPSGGWNHSMAVIARRTTSDGRKLFLIWNSWGDNWASGPYWNDMPEGSFWIEWNVMDSMLSRGDSFAYGGLDGFKPRALDGLGAEEYLGQLKVKGGNDAESISLRGGSLGNCAGDSGPLDPPDTGPTAGAVHADNTRGNAFSGAAIFGRKTHDRFRAGAGSDPLGSAFVGKSLRP